MRERERERRLRLVPWGTAALWLVVTQACNDVPTPTAADKVVAPEFSQLPGIDALSDVPARSIEVPLVPRAWDLSGSALEETLADGEWYATVAFKEAASPRIAANSSGRALRQAVTKETAEAGLELLESNGVRILRYNASIAAAHVVFRQGVASELRENDLVDCIEPRHVYYRPGAASVARPVRLWVRGGLRQVVDSRSPGLSGAALWRVSWSCQPSKIERPSANDARGTASTFSASGKRCAPG